MLDEADRLLAPEFRPQVLPILESCTHPTAQKCFLSATIPADLESLSRSHMHDPVRIIVGTKDSASTSIDQTLQYCASEPGKLLHLRNMIHSGALPYPSLVFVQSIERAEELHRAMEMEGVRCALVHGGRSKLKRDEAVRGFREGNVWVLVVTDVLARGMDFRGVKVVVNYGELHSH